MISGLRKLKRGGYVIRERVKEEEYTKTYEE